MLVDNHGYLYANSIRENLLIGNPAANDSDLWNVLEQVSLADFVRKLPEQLNENLEEDGSNLSGGQRQRLLLARALLRQAEVYVFDEITSGVDLESEKIILLVLQELAKEKSCSLFRIAYIMFWVQIRYSFLTRGNCWKWRAQNDYSKNPITSKTTF